MRRLMIILISTAILITGFYFYFFFGRTCCAPPPDLFEEGMPFTAPEYTELLGLYEKTKAPFDEAGTLKKICALKPAAGRSIIALWKNEERAVFRLTPDPADMPDGPVVYFNGQGDQLLAIPLRPVLENDTQAGLWNYQVTSLLDDLNRGKNLVCPGALE